MTPAYLLLAEDGGLAARAEAASQHYQHCMLCGWRCGIDRSAELGPCRAGVSLRVASAYVHFGEEKPLSRGGGSGAIFFAHCDMRCQFCQTFRWNIQGQGRDLSPGELAALMLDLQGKAAENINLVSPTHHLPGILAAVHIAARRGLRLPLIWNSGGYDTIDALRLLDGVVDLYLPDMKYADESLARRWSGVRGYPQINRAAVIEMQRQVGSLRLDEQGRARRGLLLRHLVMPGQDEDSRAVLDWIAATLGPNTYLSLMDQYRPAYRALTQPGLDRALTRAEYQDQRNYALSLGLTRLDDSLLLGTESEA